MGFPENLLWGGASAGFQYRGGFGENGRDVITQDFATDDSADMPRMVTYRLPDGTRGETPARTSMLEGAMRDFREGKYYPSRQIVNFYHHYKEDIRYLAGMGLNCMRFSVYWTRIFPTGTEEKPNRKGLDLYEVMVDECLEYDIQLLITIHHDEFPAYLTEHYQGWMSRIITDCYVKLCRALFERLGGRMKCWLTFNEVNTLSGYSHLGTTDCTMAATYQCVRHVFVVSAPAVKLGHGMMSDALFGIMYAASPAYTGICRPQDVPVQMTIRRCTLSYIDVMARGEYPVQQADFFKDNEVELVIESGDKEILSRGTIDYISFSMYRSTTCTANSELKMNVLFFDPDPYLEATPWGQAIDPLGLRYVPDEFWDRYQLPLFAVESGLDMIDEPDEDFWVEDDYRIDYLKDHFKAIKDAVELDGIPVLDYTMWGGTGPVSLPTGEMKKRYGWVYADVGDKGKGSLKRYPKKSFHWMKDLMEDGSRTPLNS